LNTETTPTEFQPLPLRHLLAGADFIFKGAASSGDALIVGGLTGYSASTITLNGGRHEISGPSVGTYATYVIENFFADALIKADFLSFNTSVANLPSDANMTNYSLLGNIGYKFNLNEGWYIEPTSGFEYVRIDLSNQRIAVATTSLLDDAHLLRARIGARVGTSWVSNNLRIEPSLLALAYYNFEASGAILPTGGGSIVLPLDQGKVLGELQGSVNILDQATGISGFVRGDLRFNDDLIGGGIKLGLRKQL
jgi:outer membrane autotransporter protein